MKTRSRLLAATLALLLPLSAFAADTVKPIGGFPYFLAGSGISSSATSITLSSLTLPQTGQELLDEDFSDTFYLTIEPGNRNKQEFVSCTTVTQSNGSTAILSGCTRGLSPITPYTASSTLQYSHAGGSTVIFSDPPQLFNQAAFKDNDETISGSWSFPTPTAGANAATKTYVDGLQNGGTLSYDQIIVAGTAGETIATGTILYFKRADARWWKADTDVPESTTNAILGIAQGPGTAGNSITNGVLTLGLDTTQVGMSAGVNLFLSSTAGATSTATTTVGLGKVKSATELYFNPHAFGVGLGNDNTFSGTNSFATSTFTGTVTTNGIATSTFATASTSSFTATFTWAKPAGLKQLIVEVVGGGGAGAADNQGGGGGGGGAYCKAAIPSNLLASTVTMTVGAAGAQSSVGGHVVAGAGAAASGGTQGAGGDCSGTVSRMVEIENFDGTPGGTDTGPTPDFANGGDGGDSVYGRGGQGVVTAPNGASGNLAGRAATGYGAGSGGGVTTASGAAAPGLIILTEIFN